MKVLVVGQDSVASRVGRALRLRWPELGLTVADNADVGRRFLARDEPDVIFVSAPLSDGDDLAPIRDIRLSTEAVIILIGPYNEPEIIDALEAGADDYLMTPMSESVIVAKVGAALRRTARPSPTGESVVRCADLVIDPASYEVRLGGRSLYLTPTEFKLLYHLTQHQGFVVTQHALESVVWGSPDRLYIDVLRKHVQRLRQKLGPPRKARVAITTVPRVGYKLMPTKVARSRS